jgi:hypothetical protein
MEIYFNIVKKTSIVNYRDETLGIHLFSLDEFWKEFRKASLSLVTFIRQPICVQAPKLQDQFERNSAY